ncbi:hypothetical protein MTR04_10230 [Staphylococcus agnetis]|uniref:hypothetical protein n=1 Tax=Staphylococcus agnetis TaxID=985762 RepID=UPI00208E93F3|nr:hypothetical protein [Staphylococcus agnetis]MCO4360693.1 hypothetical protein [Staphylococcus agnetis]
MVAFTLMGLIIVGILYLNHKDSIKDKDYIQKVINEVDTLMSSDFKPSNINSIGKDSNNNDVIVFDNGFSMHLSASQILFVENEEDEEISYLMPDKEDLYDELKRTKGRCNKTYVIESVAPSVFLKILRSRYDELKR